MVGFLSHCDQTLFVQVSVSVKKANGWTPNRVTSCSAFSVKWSRADQADMCVPSSRWRRRHVLNDRCRCSVRHSGAGATFSTTGTGAAPTIGARAMYSTTSAGTAYNAGAGPYSHPQAQERRKTLRELACCSPRQMLALRIQRQCRCSVLCRYRRNMLNDGRKTNVSRCDVLHDVRRRCAKCGPTQGNRSPCTRQCAHHRQPWAQYRPRPRAEHAFQCRLW